ncbi:SGNH hydrolase domain-containing protein [Paractinoplanes toevensis]|uniref:SGNH domain-containing protein n=1 Tax=Paractinoplanes toevensis TaxID=571911 RepID=A0A919T7T4_9ACTN|nr:SGNH hydrolase domain-containing protein [Actinoplanes toevensis]GIM90012.1 hypothetical protein Ato02nite_018050 [Actinoplanes toevensis]
MLEALSAVAEAEHWHLITYYATGCPFAAWPRRMFTSQFARCADWEQEVLSRIVRMKPTLVVTSNLGYRSRFKGWFTTDIGGFQPVDAYAAAYATLRDAGIKTLVINDAPAPAGGDKSDPAKYPNADPIRCLEAHPTDYAACSAPRSDWEYRDPAVDSVKRIASPKVTSVDLNDHICGPDTCDAVVGGVRVRQDDSHLTGTCVHTLMPYLRLALVASVTGR